MRCSIGAAKSDSRDNFFTRKGLPAGSYRWIFFQIVCLGAGMLVPTALAKCPNYCSQRGICTGPGDDAFCICQHGYQGNDCSIRMCPKSDDPLTTGQSDRALMLRTSADGGFLEGEVTVTFNGESASLDANAQRAGERECILAFQSMSNIHRVSCERSVINEVGGADYVISLLSFPTYPYENNIYGHFGNPPLEAFSCNISNYDRDGGVDGNAIDPSCELMDVVNENVKEYTECSNHGTCVRETGSCECNFGFKGDACDDISDADDAQLVLAEGPFFTGTTLKLRANRGLSPDFDFLRAIAGVHEVMTLTGTGDLMLHKGSLFIRPPVPGSPAESSAWFKATPPKALVVSGGSLSVDGGGADVESTRVDAPALAVIVAVASTPPDPSSGTLTRRDADWSYTGAALTVDVKEPASDNFRLLELSALRSKSSVDEAHTEGGDQHTKVDSIFAVRGDGRVSMSGGGGVFLEEGNLEVSQGDATFKGNASVGHALYVGAGGATVAAGGLRVLDGGLLAQTSSSYKNTEDLGEERLVGSLLSASHEEFSGDVLRVDAGGRRAVDSGAVLIRASAGGKDVFELKANGATSIKSGGLHVHAGGLHVGSGGVTIASGGLVIDGGIRLRSGTLTIDGTTSSSPRDSGSGEIRRQERGEGGERVGGGTGGFEVASGGIRTVSRDASTPALAASAEGVGFGGAVLSLSAPGSEASGSFRLLQDTGQGIAGSAPRPSEGTEEVFLVDGTGRITAIGGLDTGMHGEIVAGGGITSKGRLVLGKRRAVQQEFDGVSEVDAGLGTFFEIFDHRSGGPGKDNVLRITGDATAGQVLVVRNSNAVPTSGDAIIPSGYTVLFVHDGNSWRDLRVLEAAVTELSAVTGFAAANDLDIGGFTLTAQHFVSRGNDGGKVAVYGGGGLLTSDRSFTWDSSSGTLSVPRLRAAEVAEGMDFKGKPARNVALVNATMDRIPFIKTSRFMLESAVGGRMDSGVASAERGVAVFDRKGELSRADGLRVRSGGLLDVRSIGPHEQAGDVDFQGYTAHNISLSGVSTLAGLDRLEVGTLFLPTPTVTDASVGSPGTLVGGAMMVVTAKGEVRAAGEAISVETGTGTLSVPRIGPHDVAGDVDFLGNCLRNAVLESPEIRGIVAHLHAGELSITTRPAVSRGYLAVFSSEADNSADDGAERKATLGQAAGGGKLAFRDGAVQDLRLGGTTVLEGDLDMGGHRLLNFDMGIPDFDELEELTVLGALRLDAHSTARGSLLAVGVRGTIGPADTASLALGAASVTASGPVVSGELSCRGPAVIGGKLEIGGGVTVGGALELSGGMDARGTRISNAVLENVSIRGRVVGDVGIEGGLKVGALTAPNAGGRRSGMHGFAGVAGDDSGRGDWNEGKGSGRARIVAAGPGGELGVARGVEFDDEEGVFVVGKISGHEVTGRVNFAGQALLSPGLNFSGGGGISGLSSLSVGEGGVIVEGVLMAASDVIVEGSVTVAGAVMGRGPYMDSSDIRLKAEIEDIPSEDASEIIRRLRGVTYFFKTNGMAHLPPRPFPKGKQYGFIAQELGAVVPELVSVDAHGFQVVAYSRLVPILTSALSSALYRLDVLETRQQASVTENGNVTLIGDRGHLQHTTTTTTTTAAAADCMDTTADLHNLSEAGASVSLESRHKSKSDIAHHVTAGNTTTTTLKTLDIDASVTSDSSTKADTDPQNQPPKGVRSPVVTRKPDGRNWYALENDGTRHDAGRGHPIGRESTYSNLRTEDGPRHMTIPAPLIKAENDVLRDRVNSLEAKLVDLEERAADLVLLLQGIPVANTLSVERGGKKGIDNGINNRVILPGSTSE